MRRKRYPCWTTTGGNERKEERNVTPDLPLACRTGIWGLDFYLTRFRSTLIFSPTSPFRITLTGSSFRSPLLVVKRVPPLPCHLQLGPIPMLPVPYVSTYLHTSCDYHWYPRHKHTFSRPTSCSRIVSSTRSLPLSRTYVVPNVLFPSGCSV